ncbi:MAG: glycerate kinase [Bacteroidota bacterium]
MKIIIAPDKFKGSLTSAEVCSCIEQGIHVADKSIDVLSFPMADGGDGFASVMQHYTQTETIECITVDPLHRPIKASYQWNSFHKTAIIELAAASGLILLKPGERNPMKTSTYGTGLLIKDAITKGAKKIIVGIGGSATNDAGTGILSALGFIMTDADDKPLPASGENLLLIEKIIVPTSLPAMQFDIACDVGNVLYGPNGAAFIYGPQKGAVKEQIILLDKGLRHFAEITASQTNIHIADKKGSGAAGGIAAGLLPFLKAELKQGTQIVIEASNIKNALQHTDLIITGEGKIDGQSKDGKLISSIALLAKEKQIPVIGICGSLELNNEEIKELGLTYAYEMMNRSLPLEYSIKNAADLLRKKIADVMAAFVLRDSFPQI